MPLLHVERLQIPCCTCAGLSTPHREATDIGLNIFVYLSLTFALLKGQASAAETRAVFLIITYYCKFPFPAPKFSVISLLLQSSTKCHLPDWKLCPEPLQWCLGTKAMTIWAVIGKTQWISCCSKFLACSDKLGKEVTNFTSKCKSAKRMGHSAKSHSYFSLFLQKLHSWFLYNLWVQCWQRQNLRLNFSLYSCS